MFALIGVALAIYFEPTHCVRGWLWGEAFFDGRPTSCWRGVCERDLRTDPKIIVGGIPPTPSWWGRCRAGMCIEHHAPPSSWQVVQHDDPNAVLWKLRR